MKKGIILKRGIAVLSLFSLLGCVAGVSLAWFQTKDDVDFSTAIDGTGDGAYYASGDGSKESPFEINKPIHLYNLTWLQYMGTYDTDTNNDGTYDDYYFTVSADLDMTGYVLPPIGTKENPFVGHFEGNEHTISNLTVSNGFEDYGTRHPSQISSFDSDHVQPEIIGFFGVVGLLTGTEYDCKTASASSVTDIYLDGITIKNASTAGTLAGFLAGYVNAPVTDCGVGYSHFDFVSGTKNLTGFDDVSSYSLVGAINSKDYAIDGDTSGDDAGTDYGTSTNIYALYNELGSKDGNAIEKNHAYPFVKSSAAYDENGNIKINDPAKSSYAMQLSSSSTTYNITSATNIAATSSGNNIGYYVGSDIKVYSEKGKNITYSKDTIVIQNTSSISKVDDSIIEYLNSDINGSRRGDYAIRLSGNDSTTTSDLAYIVSNATNNSDKFSAIENAYVGSWEGISYTTETKEETYVDENGETQTKETKEVVCNDTSKKPLLLLKRTVWVAPIKAGTFHLVIINPEKETSYQAAIIYKLKRAIPQDYSSYFTSAEAVGYINYSNSVEAKYWGCSVTDEDIQAGYEFAIVGTGQPYIAYMDIGANDSSGTDTTTKTTLSIDFVYAVKEADNTISLIKITDTTYYHKSEIVFEISLESSSTASTAEQQYYFFRQADVTTSSGYTPSIYYFLDPSGTSSSGSLTSSSLAMTTPKNTYLATDKTCTAK